MSPRGMASGDGAELALWHSDSRATCSGCGTVLGHLIQVEAQAPHPSAAQAALLLRSGYVDAPSSLGVLWRTGNAVQARVAQEGLPRFSRGVEPLRPGGKRVLNAVVNGVGSLEVPAPSSPEQARLIPSAEIRQYRPWTLRWPVRVVCWYCRRGQTVRHPPGRVRPLLYYRYANRDR